MRRSFPASISLARGVELGLRELLAHHRRRDRTLYLYPLEMVGVIKGSLLAVESTTFTSREFATWFRRFKRWRKHPVLRDAPPSTELVECFTIAEATLRRRYPRVH